MPGHVPPNGAAAATDRHVLRVDRTEFLMGLRLTTRCRALGSGTFSFQNGMLKVQFQDFFFTAHAVGQWYGEGTVPATFVRNLAKRPPHGTGPLDVTYEGKRITIGAACSECKWKGAEPPPIVLPPDATLVEVLAVPMEHSQEHIAQSGLSEVVAQAESKRDALLADAATTLACLDVSVSDLRTWLEDRIGRRNRPERGPLQSCTGIPRE